MNETSRPNPIQAPFGESSARLPYEGICDIHRGEITTVRNFYVVANREVITLCKSCCRSLCHK